MPRIRRGTGLTIILLVIGVLSGGPGYARDITEDATRLVERISVEFVSVLKSNGATAARESRIAELLRSELDFDFMSRFVLGNQWQAANPRQRIEFQKVFTDFVVTMYSRRLADSGAISFAVTSVRTAENGNAVIGATFERSDMPPRKLGFRVREVGGRLVIIDVDVEGASLLLAQRVDFRQVVRKQGMDALIDALEQKLGER